MFWVVILSILLAAIVIMVIFNVCLKRKIESDALLDSIMSLPHGTLAGDLLEILGNPDEVVRVDDSTEIYIYRADKTESLVKEGAFYIKDEKVIKKEGLMHPLWNLFRRGKRK